MAALAFLLGGMGYMGLELLWRKRTHWSMGLAGGLCVTLMYLLFAAVAMPAWAAYLCGAAIVSTVELAFGLVLNVRLGMNVWDYSAVPFNFKGQICLRFALIWGLAGILVWWMVRLLS
jgi:uncharacterized membrane protein